jgi:hypothetical protein
MPSKTQAIIVAAMTTLASAGANAITIQFDYTYDTNNFFANADATFLMERAGNYFASRITDDLDAIESNGGNNFTASIRRPDTGTIENLPNYDVPADTLIVYVGSRELGGSTLGQGGPSGYGVSGTAAFLETVAKRGEVGEVEGANANEFAPWGGTIAFDTSTNWDFETNLYPDASIITDGSPGVTITANDFYSVALHELAHVLGFGTSDAWRAQVSNGAFTGSASAAVHGADVPLFGDEVHWEEGLEGMVMGFTQEAAMDPNLTFGTRKLMTDIDLAALDDIGWDVTPIPLPAAGLPFLAAVLLSAVAARRGRRQHDAV